MPTYRLPFSEPLAYLSDKDWERLLQLRQSLGTGDGMGRIVSRISNELTLGPDHTPPSRRVLTEDDRVALEFVEAVSATTGERGMHLAPARRKVYGVVLWDIHDTCNLHRPRAEAPVHNLRDVLNGSYKPGMYKPTEIGGYQYTKALTKRKLIEGYHNKPLPPQFTSPDRFRTFDPRPSFEETVQIGRGGCFGSITYMGR